MIETEWSPGWAEILYTCLWWSEPDPEELVFGAHQHWSTEWPYDHNENILVDLCFSFPTLTLIPWPRLTWPCGPLTFSFWLCLSFWLSLWLPLPLFWFWFWEEPLPFDCPFDFFDLPFPFLPTWFTESSFETLPEMSNWSVIDLLWVWGDAVVEVVDEQGVNVIPCWLLVDAEGKSIGKRSTNILKC